MSRPCIACTRIGGKVRTGYHGVIYEPESLLRIVSATALALQEIECPFESIAFSGSSGAAVAYSLSAMYDYRLTHIHKTATHYTETGGLEGWVPRHAFVIVDDFISSGTTIARILKGVQSVNSAAKCVAIVCYKPSLHFDATVVARDFYPIPTVRA